MEYMDYTVSDHILDRLVELGVRHIFGVPGDYNLGFLDRVVRHPGITWVGCTNELNAAYAADGYARIAGLGAVLTTYGVGELSALNGIAGAFAENVGVVQITGAPSSALMRAGAPVHHSFADGDWERFARMYREVTCADAFLREEDACDQVDTVLRRCRDERLPVHLTLPSDVAGTPTMRSIEPLGGAEPVLSGVQTLERALHDLLGAAPGRPSAAVVVGPEAARFGERGQVRALVDALDVPSASLPLGKGTVDEEHRSYVGLYAGGLGDPRCSAVVEAADVVVSLGALATGGTMPFTASIDPARLVEVRPHVTTVAGVEHEVAMELSLSTVERVLRGSVVAPRPNPPHPVPEPTRTLPQGSLSQATLWNLLGAFVTDDDVLVVEAGTSFYGALEVALPSNAELLTQGMWSSIGYTLPATLGAALAAPHRRAILVIGDGSFLLTSSELSTLFALDAAPIVVLVNNDGYTVERAIHGPDAVYNDIPTWNWQAVPNAAGASHARVQRATTTAELTDVLRSARTESARPSFIEAVLPRMDVPPLLARVADVVTRRNAYVP